MIKTHKYLRVLKKLYFLTLLVILLDFLYYCFLILGFAIKDAIYPKKTAAAIPPAEALTPPINAPNKPCSLTPSIAPLARFAPKPVNGTVAPAPAKSITYL